MSDDKFLIQGFGLLVVDQNEIPVAVESLDRLLELGFPLDRAVRLQAVLGRLAIQDALRVRRLNEAAKDVSAAFAVEVLHFLINAFANQLADRDALRRETPAAARGRRRRRSFRLESSVSRTSLTSYFKQRAVLVCSCRVLRGLRRSICRVIVGSLILESSASKKRLADDDRERGVALERQKQVILRRPAIASRGRCRGTRRSAP